jgi:hypothetical protein
MPVDSLSATIDATLALLLERGLLQVPQTAAEQLQGSLTVLERLARVLHPPTVAPVDSVSSFFANLERLAVIRNLEKQ